MMMQFEYMPLDLSFTLFCALLAVASVIFALFLIDHNERVHNRRAIMLTQRIESLERTHSEVLKDLYEWQGLPRKLLECDLPEEEVI